MANGRYKVLGGDVEKELQDMGSGSHAEIVSVGDAGAVKLISATVTRPANTTAYASGDLVANSTTAGSVVPLSFANAARAAGKGGKIVGARLTKSNAGLTNASFRLHLFTAAPATVTDGDNSALSTSGVADYIGALDVVVDRAFTDGAFGRSGAPLSGNFLEYVGATTTLYGLLEARGAYTPASGEVFTVTIAALLD